MIAKSSGMRIKAFFVVLVGALLAFSLVGCGSSRADQASSGGNEQAASSAPVNLDNAIVVYYSASGTTQTVAEEIANDTGAATFQVQAAEVYSTEDLDYNDVNSRVYREYVDESLRGEDQSTTVPDWGSYDTVFLGYPIWWGGAAWPMSDFVEANDFTGKTVVPFCTSMTSGLGSSAKNLAALAGTGEWTPGMRFTSNVTAEEVQEWLDTLQ